MAGLGGYLFGEWEQTISVLAHAPRDFREAKHVALLQDAEFFRGKILDGLRAQEPGGTAFKPLSATTIAMRQLFGFRGTKALLYHGDLWRSIKVHDTHAANDSVFVGVLRTTKDDRGHSLVDIASLQENGSKPIVIRITPKMAALLHRAFRTYGPTNRMGPPRPSTGVIVVQIPPRPFMAPVFEQWGKGPEASKRFAERFAKQMKGKGPWVAARNLV